MSEPIKAEDVIVGHEKMSVPDVVQCLFNLVKQHVVDGVRMRDWAYKADEIMWMSWEVDGHVYKVYQFNENDELVVGGLTPEQAVAATVKDSTCEIRQEAFNMKDVKVDGFELGDIHPLGFRCTSCGAYQAVMNDSLYHMSAQWRYCPMCGRRVEREDS